MALSFADSTPVVISNEPYLVTKNTVTITLDGTATSGAFAGIAHGGPSGREPFALALDEQTLSASDSVGASAFLKTAVDTTNDEVDGTFIVSGAGTNTETCSVDVLFYFLPKAPDVGRNAPVSEAAPSNANI